MKAFTLLSSLAFALLVYAGPIPEANPDIDVESLDSSGRPWLIVCEKKESSGICLPIRVRKGRCEDFLLNFQNMISSAKAGGGTACHFFTETGCRGRKLEMADGGTGHMNFKELGFNDDIESYRCI